MPRIAIHFNDRPSTVKQNSISSIHKSSKAGTYGSDHMPATWGKVLEITDVDHVKVELSNGIVLDRVPIISSTGVSEIDATHATGHKNIPPIGSIAIILYMDGIRERPIIIGYWFDLSMSSLKYELLKSDEQHIEVNIDESGWAFKKNKKTGLVNIDSPVEDNGAKVSFTVDAPNSITQIEQFLSSTDINKISMGGQEVRIEDHYGNIFVMDSIGVSITDKQENKITTNNIGIKIEDKNGNKIETGAVSTRINGTALEVLL